MRNSIKSHQLAVASTRNTREERYWLEKLSGELVRSSFPDETRNSTRQYQRDTMTFQLDSSLSSGLIKLSNKSDSRLFMILLAGLKMLLYRYTGNTDLVLAVPAVKQEFEAEFINTVLILRDRLHHGMTFKEFLLVVKQTLVEANNHQNYPIEILFRQLNITFEEGVQSLVDIAILLQNIHDEKYLNPIKLNMLFSFLKTGQIVKGEVKYNALLYKKEQVGSIVKHFQYLLKNALLKIDTPVALIDMLSEEEKGQLLLAFNDTRKDYSTGKTIHDLFEEQVKKTGDSIALMARGHNTDHRSQETENILITYNKLYKKSVQLAHLLIAKGVTADTIVGIMIERPLEMIIGILGILKAGGAYLPIDPFYPEERVKYMLADSDASVLLSNGGEIVKRISVAKKTYLRLSSAPETCLAYLIYTSGTTGRPKGVGVEHRQAVNTLLSRREAYCMDSRDVSLQLFSYSFDGFITSFFTPLISGCRTVILNKGDIKDLFKIKQVILKNRVTHFISVPSLYRGIIGNLTAGEASSLKVVTLAGEALPSDILEMTRAKNNSLEIVNEYGVTEAAVMSTIFRHQEIVSRIKIGKPIANTTIYILNKKNSLQPVGIPGELCIAGAGMARGYLNNPELTARKFTANPFKPHQRIYKTGDLAQWLKDGNIEFLGRSDHQVKLRGLRIEPGEIENLLSFHPAVKESFVMALENKSGGKQLAAFVVPDPGNVFTVSQMLRFQKQGWLKDRKVLDMHGHMPVIYINRKEVELLHEKIFEKQAYLKHGISLNEGACIFDVGAHIGLFVLFINETCPNAVIYAFEPLPPIFEVLQLNASLYGIDAHLFACGVAARQRDENFTFYPHASALSGRFPDTDKEIMRSYLEDRPISESTENSGTLSKDQINDLLEERLTVKQFICPTKTLSQLIRENGVKQIDLLKVTAEKSELEVLKGIKDEDWAKILQLVLEVDNVDGRLEGIKNLVESHGYKVTVDQDEELQNTGLYTIYARLPQAEGGITAGENPGRSSNSRRSPRQLAEELKGFLRERLPEFMVPQNVVLLDALPLTSNSKIDKKALQLPEDAVGRQAPRDNKEETLADIWSELLGIEKEKISIDGNFFEYGGNSLTSTILESRIHKAFDVKIPLAELFKSPTIRGLSGYIKKTVKDKYFSIKPAEKKEYYILSSAQKMLYVQQQIALGGTAYNMPLFLLIEGELERKKLLETFKKLIQKHESLRTSFDIVETEPVQKIHDTVEFEIGYYETHPDNDSEDVNFMAYENRAVKNFVQAFDLSRAPLLRVELVKTGEHQHLLMMDMHHIISDGVSHNVLINDFMALYYGEELPELKLHYKDFVQWCSDFYGSNEIKKQEDYWLKEFEGEIPELTIHTDYVRPAVRSFEGDRIHFEINCKQTKGLKNLAKKEEATLFMVLLAIYNILLSKLSGKVDIVVGTGIAGRRHMDLDKIIGMFVNTLALRNYPAGEKTFKGFVREVKERTLRAFENQDYLFEDLVEKVATKRNLARNPLFDTVFLLQNIETNPVHTSNVEKTGLKLKRYSYENKVSKFDIALSCVEVGNKLAFTATYCTKLFKKETIEMFLDYFKKIISIVVENENILLKEIEFSQDVFITDAKVHQYDFAF
ncbi:MAG: amino acid adenylation domain-containing protein [Candidatus Aminicenantes bacterium]|nr:MAG: amino acid adenylation domain-containing protein [Candidatus Aminicenantes bacterium]